MQIGIRFHDLAQGSLEERAAMAAEQGFTCAHLALSKIAPYKMTVPELTPGWAMHVKHAMAKENLDIAVLGCYLNLSDPDAEAVKRMQEVYKAHLRFSSILGAGVVGTETGTDKNIEYNHSDEAFEYFVRNLEPVARYAEKTGTILAVEPVVRHVIYNPKRARQMLDMIASPNLQIIFDPVNLLDMDNYKNRDELFAEAMDLLRDEIAVLHLKDFKVEDGKMKSIAAGTGEMDFSEIIKFAKEYKPYIHATLEDTVPENAVMAREHIQSIFNEI